MGKAFTHGGQREGAGRHNLSMTVNHMKRPRVSGRAPLLITWRQEDDLPLLKSKKKQRALYRAILKAQKFGLKVISYGIHRREIHFLIKAKNNEVLAKGMQSLGISLAKSLNRFTERKGRVFRGRYRLKIIRTQRELRKTLNFLRKVSTVFERFVERFLKKSLPTIEFDTG